MSKITKKQLQQSIDLLNKENSSQHTYLMRIKRALKSIDIDILSNEFDESKPQLKQLDQSVFNGLDEKWWFAAVDSDTSAYAYEARQHIEDNRYWVSDFGMQKYIGKGYDASNWQNSLIERDDIAKELLEVDLSSELTGSDLCRKMLERGDRCVMCVVGTHKEAVVINGIDGEGFTSRGSHLNYHTPIPINNQGEPLTASEAGF